MKTHDIESAAIYTGGRDGVASERLQSGEDMAKAQQSALERNFDLATLQATIQSMSAAMEKLQIENESLLDLVRQLTINKAETPKQPEPEKPKRVPFLQPDAYEPRPTHSAFSDDDDDDDDEDEDEGLQEIHIKDAGKPGKYKGEVGKWRHWSLKMKSFLDRRDPRWGKLLDIVKSDSKDPYDDVKEKEIFGKLQVHNKSLRRKFKEQLYEYLEEYTEGIPHANVVTGSVDNVMEVLRQLFDENFSTRDRHLRKEYRRVIHPRQSGFTDLKKNIAAWETELAQYQVAANYDMTDKDRIMCLEDICPDALQIHLVSKEHLKTYMDYKMAINDFLVNRERWSGSSSKPKVNWMGLPVQDDENGEDDDGDENGFIDESSDATPRP